MALGISAGTMLGLLELGTKTPWLWANLFKASACSCVTVVIVSGSNAMLVLLLVLDAVEDASGAVATPLPSPPAAGTKRGNQCQSINQLHGVFHKTSLLVNWSFIVQKAIEIKSHKRAINYQ
jgi:hypothetical protein